MQITPPFFAPYRQKKEDFFMSEKKVGKRLLTWVLVLVMTLSLLPLNVLAAHPVGPAKVIRPDDNKYLTYQFYVGEDKVAEQIIKTGDTLLEPKVTVLDGKRLTGWYTENDTLFDGFGEYTETIEKNSTVKLYAKFEDVYYVFFKDTTDRIVATKEGVTGVEIKFDDVSFPVESDESITGWYLEGDQGKTAVTSVTLESTNVTLCAIVEKGHWITFDSKGGSNVAPQFVRSGDSCAAPSAPTKPGYDFVGWYTDEETNNEFEFGNTLSDSPTLYAKWTPSNSVSYTVIHWWENANDDGYSFHERETKYGKVEDSTNAEAKTYSITDKSLTGQSITRKNVFSPQAIEQQTIKNDGSTIVNIYYKRAEYKLSFGYYKWTGRWEEIASIAKKYGENISSSEWPKNGSQANWKIDKSEKFIAYLSTMPLDGGRLTQTSDMGWENTATYYVETLNGSESGAIKEGSLWFIVHHYDKTRGTSNNTVGPEDRYAITGFKPISNLGTEVGQKYKDAKFYYSRNSYNIVYMSNGVEVNNVSYKFEASITDAKNYEPTTPPAGKEGYIFDGWYDAPTGGSRFDFANKIMPAQTITVYARWVAPVHKVEFVVDNKVVTEWTKDDVAHNSTIGDLPTPESSNGDTFLGWVDANGKPFHPSTKITGDLTLHAKFGNKAGYSVTYVTEGSSPVTDDKLYAEDAYATVLNGPSTAPAGKVFLYWNASSDSSGKKYYPNDKVLVPKGGVTLTAVYGPVAQVLTLTYHSNYPDGTDTTNTTAVESNLKNNALIPVAAKDKFTAPTGYEFDCWNTKADGTGDKFAAGSSARVDNIGSNDLYAQWKPIQITDEITVTIKGNTSTVTYDGTEKSVTGYTVERSDNRYTENDFTFSGTALAKGTDAGTYPMGLKPENFENKNANFSKVTFVVTDGSLTITKREVTLTSASDSKVYDGTALTKPEVTVTGSFVDGEVTDIKATGTITDVGTVTNTITFAKGEKFKDSNYAITKTEGTLEVTPITDKVTVTITGNTKTVRYNGKEQSVTGFTYTAPEGVKVTPKDGFKPEAKGTDKGTYYMYLTKGDFIVSSKIYKEFEIIVKDGYLEITRSGGHHPRPKPTVEIEDDDALGLNTTDHFAYIVGYGNGEVRPQNNITRAEVATIFFRLLTDDVRDENLTKTNRYSDVTRADWYNTAVSTLSSMGIITGYPDGTFRPNAAITRAEFAAIAARFDSNGDKTTAKFSDIATHWAKDEISIAYNNGWITGYPDGTFGPQRDITRAETMTLVNRVLNRQPETEDDLLPNMTVWTDNANPNAWYYLAVQEATNSHYYKFKTNSQYEKWTELRETRDWTQLEK